MSEYKPRSKRRKQRLRHRSSKGGGFLDGKEKKLLSKLWGRGRDIPEKPDEGHHQCSMCFDSCQRR